MPGSDRQTDRKIYIDRQTDRTQLMDRKEEGKSQGLDLQPPFLMLRHSNENDAHLSI